MAKKAMLLNGEAVSFKKAFAAADSRKRFFLIDGKLIQCLTNYAGNENYCAHVFDKATTVLGPMRFERAKKLALKDAYGLVDRISKLTLNSYSKYKKE